MEGVGGGVVLSEIQMTGQAMDSLYTIFPRRVDIVLGCVEELGCWEHIKGMK